MATIDAPRSEGFDLSFLEGSWIGKPEGTLYAVSCEDKGSSSLLTIRLDGSREKTKKLIRKVGSLLVWGRCVAVFTLRVDDWENITWLPLVPGKREFPWIRFPAVEDRAVLYTFAEQHTARSLRRGYDVIRAQANTRDRSPARQARQQRWSSSVKLRLRSPRRSRPGRSGESERPEASPRQVSDRPRMRSRCPPRSERLLLRSRCRSRSGRKKQSESRVGCCITMTRRCFSMKKGEMSTIIGESSSGNSWMLKNGKHVEKNHEDLSWEVADA
jgi:hypothetical protein